MTQSLSLYRVLIFSMMLVLPYANITKLFDVEDGLIFFLYPLCAFCFIILFLKNWVVRITRNKIMIPIYLTLTVGLASGFLGQIEYGYLVPLTFKFLLLSVFCWLIERHGGWTGDYILQKYSQIFIFSIILSLSVSLVVTKPEFIFYDGSANRFGGFHFELFNFSYSTALCVASLIYRGSSRLLCFFLLCLGVFISKSNFSFIYALIFVSVYYSALFTYRSVLQVATLGIICAPILIGTILNQLEFLSVFSVRESSSFDHTGSSVYARLYPYSLAMQQIASDGLLSFLPRGFGYFESSELVKSDPFSYGGTGSPKELVNLGLLLFVLLVLNLAKSIPERLEGNNARLFAFIWLSSISFISFGSGFFNLFAWIVIFSLLNWSKKDV